MASKKSAKKAKPAAKPEVVTEKPAVYFAPPTPKLGDAPTFPVVNVKCRRGSDKISEGQSCSSLAAENMSTPGSASAQFRCTKCKYTWRVQMGGTFNSPV